MMAIDQTKNGALSLHTCTLQTILVSDVGSGVEIQLTETFSQKKSAKSCF